MCSSDLIPITGSLPYRRTMIPMAVTGSEQSRPNPSERSFKAERLPDGPLLARFGTNCRFDADPCGRRNKGTKKFSFVKMKRREIVLRICWFAYGTEIQQTGRSGDAGPSCVVQRQWR